MDQVTIKQGWLCPRCGVINAPWRECCECVAKCDELPAITDKIIQNGLWKVDINGRRIRDEDECDHENQLREMVKASIRLHLAQPDQDQGTWVQLPLGGLPGVEKWWESLS